MILRVLQEIVNRHQVLRTSFPVANGQPIEKVANEVPGLLVEADLSEEFKADGDAAGSWILRDSQNRARSNFG